MNDFITWLAENPYLIVISTVFGIFGTLFGIYSYRKNKIKKIIAYSKKDFTLLDKTVSKIKGLEVKYNSRNISNLTVTEMCISNGGNASLRKNDIYEKYPLELLVCGKDIEIIDVEIESKSADTCEFKVYHTKNKWIVNFDYLEIKDFLNLRIYHTGEKNCIFLGGKIIDGKIKEQPLKQLIKDDIDAMLLTDEDWGIMSFYRRLIKIMLKNIL